MWRAETGVGLLQSKSNAHTKSHHVAYSFNKLVSVNEFVLQAANKVLFFPNIKWMPDRPPACSYKLLFPTQNPRVYLMLQVRILKVTCGNQIIRASTHTCERILQKGRQACSFFLLTFLGALKN